MSTLDTARRPAALPKITIRRAGERDRAAMAEMFPTRMRYSGVSLGYQVTSIAAGSRSASPDGAMLAPYIIMPAVNWANGAASARRLGEFVAVRHGFAGLACRWLLAQPVPPI